MRKMQQNEESQKMLHQASRSVFSVKKPKHFKSAKINYPLPLPIFFQPIGRVHF